MLKDTRLAPDFSITALAEAAEGHSGSDLRELCRNAAMVPVREIMRSAEGNEEMLAKGQVEVAFIVFYPLNDRLIVNFRVLMYDHSRWKISLRTMVQVLYPQQSLTMKSYQDQPKMNNQHPDQIANNPIIQPVVMAFTCLTGHHSTLFGPTVLLDIFPLFRIIPDHSTCTLITGFIVLIYIIGYTSPPDTAWITLVLLLLISFIFSPFNLSIDCTPSVIPWKI